MAEIPDDLHYTEEHEYLKATDEEGVYLVGITDYAQGELGDVVFVELPSAGSSFEKMAPFGTIEAVKAVSDLYSPLSGEIVDVNSDLDDDPSVVEAAVPDELPGPEAGDRAARVSVGSHGGSVPPSRGPVLRAPE